MKISLFPEKCIACGLCQTYSDLFDYHDDGIVKFTTDNSLTKDIPECDAKIISAVKNCPTKALTIL